MPESSWAACKQFIYTSSFDMCVSQEPPLPLLFKDAIQSSHCQLVDVSFGGILSSPPYAWKGQPVSEAQSVTRISESFPCQPIDQNQRDFLYSVNLWSRGTKMKGEGEGKEWSLLFPLPLVKSRSYG